MIFFLQWKEAIIFNELFAGETKLCHISNKINSILQNTIKSISGKNYTNHKKLAILIDMGAGNYDSKVLSLIK